MARRNVCVIGVGMTKFERCERDFTELVRAHEPGGQRVAQKTLAEHEHEPCVDVVYRAAAAGGG
ncbi:MAG: hypothetical protein E6J79_10975 [Deltaproteobacteria bacterium]|nr:MAG: hypothetical protein E6J79_10975 [Deltaproteobacteria bacterium]